MVIDTMSQDAQPKSDFTSTSNTLYGMPEGADVLRISQMAADAPILWVAEDDARMQKIKDLFAFFNPGIEVLEFPAWDCLPYDRVSPSSDVIGQRIDCLMRLKGNKLKQKNRVIVTSIAAVTQKLPPENIWDDVRLSCEKGGFINPEKLTAFLVKNGFNKAHIVREPGEFAVRGGIIDIYPPSDENPVRLDLFGNEIETIKTFDALTQLTIEEINVFDLTPASEVFLNDETIARFRKKYRESFGVMRGDDTLFESVSEGRKYQGMEHWLPLFYNGMSTLFDYLPNNTKIINDPHIGNARASRLEQILDFYDARKEQAEREIKHKHSVTYHAIIPDTLYLNEQAYDALISSFERYELSPFKNPNDDKEVAGERTKSFGDVRAQDMDKLYEAVAVYLNDLQEKKKKTLIACYSEGSCERLKELFVKHGVENCVVVKNYGEALKQSRHQIVFVLLPLENGFITDHLAVLTEQDILGDRLTRPVRKKKDSENFIQEISSLKEGDLVVHIQHGIGRFLSLETIKVGGTAHDCLKIEYHDGNKLYVPVENIEMLTRYGSDNNHVSLDRLGGTAWEARKGKIKKDLLAMAGGLLSIAAARQLKHGEVLEVSEGLYQEFAAQFPYNETEDQLKSINAVIDDLHKGRPMDRLVCGDVGFGKTEVALRAAFVAAMSGVQVAIVAPTTLLARQHYLEFTRRFKHFPIKIAQLSRLVKGSEATQTKEWLRDGHVDVVIGTHALLAESIKFKQLGLLIVDEEQKFGVKQKERLKQLKENVHILTLTATPIPRTLQLALTGVRDLSLITTPPVDRLAVRTYAMPYDPIIIREALMREHYRGGQSFYVCPRISDLDDVEKQLKELVPELKVIKAHGQMPANVLEDKITAYYEGQYDVLLATNIIESGLDIPNANTMVVHRAELFGLSQLYQIRGRIGRSKIRGYAYMTYEPKKKLTDQAQERLRVLETLDTLGAGFQIASHDMDIRGAGNLLGEEQSGHVKEIGIELYQQMLEEAIEDAKFGRDGDFLDDQWSPQISLGTNVFIPEDYIPDLNVRLNIYRRASGLEAHEIDGFSAELIDRFGPIPEEVKNLMDIIAIKKLCKQASVEKVEAGPKGAVLSFRNNEFGNVEKLIDYMQRKSGTVRMRPDQKLVFIGHWPKVEKRVEGINQILSDLIALL